MAGRYVVVEFRTKNDADNFIENEVELQTQGGKVIAEFVRPTKFCECPDKQRQHAGNWTKGRRTGLYLCKRCKRPSVFHREGIFKRLQYVFGYNLLESGSAD